MKLPSKLLSALLGCLVIMGSAPPAVADDSEIFTNTSFLATGVQPNVLFIIDTSGSMDTEVNSYDPATDYTSVGVCTAGRLYWSTSNSSNPPDCRTSNQWISDASNRCRAATLGMVDDGWWNGRTQQISTGNPTAWINLVPGVDRKVECSNDNNSHGDLPGTTAPGAENKYARNGTGTADSGRWGNNASSNQVNWTNKQRISFYSTNYMNWYYGSGTSTRKTRLSVVRDVAKKLITDLDGVNLGLMRYDQNAEGGMVTYPISALTPATRTAMKSELDTYVADGYTPLSETLYEAHQYFTGGRVQFGDTSFAAGRPRLSEAGSRTGGTLAGKTYDSPMDFSCQNNFIVYLTDGLPTKDTSADDEIEGLPDFATDSGSAKCPKEIDNPDPSFPDSGRCLENLARYMHNHDLRSDVIGKQSVTTYVVGFGDDIATSADFLKAVATAGGGQAYTQGDAAGLTAALEEIFDQVLDTSGTTFVAPAVSVNAFNRTQNFNQLFVSVFAPSEKKHWPGNLKKYRIQDGQIYGVGTTPAVDPVTEFFKDTAKALNTPTGDPADGPSARLGGSAARLPDWNEASGTSRKLYTNMGASTDLTTASNAIKVSNALITAAMVGAPDATERQNIIEFSRGRDVTDENENGDTTENRKAMGDPMHARPAIVVYGGTVANPIGTVFTPTNDGYLHAFDMTTGDELWSFIPKDYLLRLGDLYDNPPQATRDYALDGDVRVFKYDVDEDGIVEPADGDKVYLIFGTARGGSYYYSLDVTDRTTPVFRWRKSPAELPKLGKTWSAPTIARVSINGATQNTNKYVLIFGAGYDESQEGYTYTTDGVGNAIYMLDLESGALLWSASSAGANLNLADMTHSIPSAIQVVDLDQDRFADRMYASDMGGRVWRFDITNGNSAASLVTGGVLASLGGAAAGASPPLSATRRFYNAPDVALFAPRGARPFFNIAIGSGYRGHPLETDTQDRFYSLRDYAPFTKRTNASYSGTAIALDGDLVDLTTSLTTVVPDGSKGWKIDFRSPSWHGEKVLSESTTASGVVFFSTYTPLSPDPTKPCLARSQNKVYAMYATNGKPFANWTDSSTRTLTLADRSLTLTTGGIAPGLNIFADPIGSVTTGGAMGGSTGGGGSDPAGDDDGDGIPNALDNDRNGNGIADANEDDDGDGITNGNEDDDGDGVPNAEDENDDGDANCGVGLKMLGHCVRFGDVNRSFWEHR